MTPINFTASTHIIKGPPGADIGDLPVASVPPYIISLWTFTPEERAAIADGKNLMLSIMARGMPPAALAKVCWDAIQRTLRRLSSCQ